MNNLTINPASNLRSRDNDINPSEIARGHPEDCTVIEIEGPNDLLRILTASTQDTIAPTQDTTSLLGVPSEVWYFDEGTDNLCKESKLPLKLTITERVTTRMWHTEDYQLNPGLYNIAFGISTQFFDASLVDSIIFYIDINGDYQSQIVEAITRKDLREFLELSNTVDQVDEFCKLMLHQQVNVGDQQGGGCKLNIKMEIRFRCNVSPEATRRVLSMHHFELYKCSKTKAQDPPTHGHKTYAHKPYVWSIDVKHCENPDDPEQSLKISRYSISGDGTRVATLSATNDSLFLDLWDISAPEGSAPHNPKKLAEKRLRCPDGRTHTDPRASIAVSWDAKYIALFPTAKESWVEQLVIYNRESDKLKVGRTFDSHPQLGKFKGEAKFHITNTNNPDTDNPDINNPDLSNEFFVTCDANSVDIYKVHGQWSHIFSFPVQAPKFIYLERLSEMTEKQLRQLTGSFAKKLIDSLQGRFFLSFSVFGSDPQPIIWDIENHSLLVAVTGPINIVECPTFATFSNDQSIVAIIQDGSIKTYWRGSNTAIGKWTVPEDLHVSRLTFVRNDTQLLVECTGSTNQGRVGYILDPMTTRMVPLDKDPIAKVLGPGEYMPGVQRCGRDKKGKNNTEPQRLYSCHNSKLDFVQLDSIVYDPDNLNTQECSQQICDGPSPVPIASKNFKLESGLEFRYTLNALPEDRDTFWSDSYFDQTSYKLSAFSLQISDGSRQRTFKIPTFILVTEPKVPAITPSAAFKDPAVTPSTLSKDPTVFFLKQKILLILCPNVMITVWRLPEKYNNECNLLAAHWIWNGSSSDTTTKSIDIEQCERHQHLFIRDSEDAEYPLRISLREPSYDSHEHEFRLTVEGLVMMYTVADDKCKKSIVQYLIENINRYQNPGSCVILWIAEKLSDVRHHELLEELLTSVLRPTDSWWIPRPDFRSPSESSPWYGFIDGAIHSIYPPKVSSKHKEPKLMEIVKIITQYCFEIAREHKDSRLTSPITALLPVLRDFLYCEASLDLLRRLAYIPMNDGTQLSRINTSPYNMRYILDICSMIVKSQWKGIFEGGRNSVFDSVYTAVFILPSILVSWLRRAEPQPTCGFQHPTVIDYLDISRKKDYLARFDMLWMSNNLSSSMDVTGYVNRMTPSWLLAPLLVIRHSFMPSHRNIECHELNLDAFDNPAIEALIEYKWNAFGFYFWLIRFLFQCIYYTLVLTVVFVQVYRGQDWIIPLYDIVIVFSAIFLWLEFTQFVGQQWKYITSPYNLFDLFVFILPMIGCVAARRGEDIAALSFSVIFVFLHFLFELRTNKNVCYYSTIIIRIFGELKVFFFIFAGGIIAYAIAILHLLHGCVTEDCAVSNNNNTEFPYEPIPAISATYFFIAGIYDPVSDEFANGDWRFRVMMAMFVLFTVILMLNVLIALINTAFDDGDRTWRNVWLESRLSCIETAENLSYKIPGFRQRFRHWFYEEICYQASDDEVAAYKKKYFPEDELDEISSVIRDMRSSLKPIVTVSTEFNNEHRIQDLNMTVTRQQRPDTRDIGNGNGSDRSSDDTQALLLQVQELQAQITEIRGLLREAILPRNG